MVLVVQVFPLDPVEKNLNLINNDLWHFYIKQVSSKTMTFLAECVIRHSLSVQADQLLLSHQALLAHPEQMTGVYSEK